MNKNLKHSLTLVGSFFALLSLQSFADTTWKQNNKFPEFVCVTENDNGLSTFVLPIKYLENAYVSSEIRSDSYIRKNGKKMNFNILYMTTISGIEVDGKVINSGAYVLYKELLGACQKRGYSFVQANYRENNLLPLNVFKGTEPAIISEKYFGKNFNNYLTVFYDVNYENSKYQIYAENNGGIKTLTLINKMNKQEKAKFKQLTEGEGIFLNNNETENQYIKFDEGIEGSPFIETNYTFGGN